MAVVPDMLAEVPSHNAREARAIEQGIERGSVVLSINGRPINNSEDLVIQTNYLTMSGAKSAVFRIQKPTKASAGWHAAYCRGAQRWASADTATLRCARSRRKVVGSQGASRHR